MNLHSFSMAENIETGILTEFKVLDIASSLLAAIAPKYFKDPLDTKAYDFVMYIVEKGTIHYECKAKEKKSFFGLKTNFSKGEEVIEKARTGYCIKTKQTIPFNPSRPYSSYAYAIWIKNGSNKNSIEKFCHKCGNQNSSSIAKPICYSCYKAGN